MEQEKVQKLAERIALLLQEDEKKADDFSSLRVSIEKINERLSTIEQKLDVAAAAHSPALIFKPSAHPSQEKFQNLEEIADTIINSLQNEKACPYEPTGKPCDHCAMCNSRGF